MSHSTLWWAQQINDKLTNRSFSHESIQIGPELEFPIIQGNQPGKLDLNKMQQSQSAFHKAGGQFAGIKVGESLITPEASESMVEFALEPVATLQEFEAVRDAVCKEAKGFLSGDLYGLGGLPFCPSQVPWFADERYKKLVGTFTDVDEAGVWRWGKEGGHQAKVASCIQVSMEAGGANVWRAIEQAQHWLMLLQPFAFNDFKPQGVDPQGYLSKRLTMWNFAGKAQGPLYVDSFEDLLMQWNQIPLLFGENQGSYWLDHEFETFQKFKTFFNRESRQRWHRWRPCLKGDDLDSVELIIEFRDYCQQPTWEEQTAIVALHHAIYVCAVTQRLPQPPVSECDAFKLIQACNRAGTFTKDFQRLLPNIRANFILITTLYEVLGYDAHYLNPFLRLVEGGTCPAFESQRVLSRNGLEGLLSDRQLV